MGFETDYSISNPIFIGGLTQWFYIVKVQRRHKKPGDFNFTRPSLFGIS
jgi:hypothetical protein